MHLPPGSPPAPQPRYIRPPLPAVTYYSDEGTLLSTVSNGAKVSPPRILRVWTAILSDSPAFIPLPLPCSNIWPATTTFRYTGTPCTRGICC